MNYFYFASGNDRGGQANQVLFRLKTSSIERSGLEKSQSNNGANCKKAIVLQNGWKMSGLKRAPNQYKKWG